MANLNSSANFNNNSFIAPQIRQQIQSAKIQQQGVINMQSIELKEGMYFQVRATIGHKRPEKKSGKLNTQFTFHGGSYLQSSKDGSRFVSFMVNPVKYNNDKIKGYTPIINDKGEVITKKTHFEIVEIVKNENFTPQEIATWNAIKKNPLMAQDYISNGGKVAEETEEKITIIDSTKWQHSVFGEMDLMRFKCSITGDMREILDDAIDNELFDKDEPKSIVLTFAIDKLNMAKEPVVLGKNTATGVIPHTYPDGSSIILQEVPVSIVRVQVIDGSTQVLDTTKYLDPDYVRGQAQKLIQEATEDKKQYFTKEMLDERAAKVNAYKNRIKQGGTGKKLLTKIGVTAAEGEISELGKLYLVEGKNGQNFKAFVDALKEQAEAGELKAGKKTYTADTIQEIVQEQCTIAEKLNKKEEETVEEGTVLNNDMLAAFKTEPASVNNSEEINFEEAIKMSDADLASLKSLDI
jgi:hypothetical protein